MEAERFVGAPAESAYAVIAKNLHHLSEVTSTAAERGFAHIKEQANVISRMIAHETGIPDVLEAVLTTDEAVRIYREGRGNAETAPLFGEVNRAEEPFFRGQMARFTRFYLCRCIAAYGAEKSLAALIPWVCGSFSEMPAVREKKIAFLRNRQASRAFEQFAKYLGGVSAVYEDNFQNACESVYTGQATYAIIPIFSTTDGRLNSFYRQMEKYELNIVLTCDIDSDDGENATTFALVYRDRLYFATDGVPLYECKITFENPAGLADIADAAGYFGATVESVEALPLMFSGRAGAFSITFGLKEADFSGLFCYLALEYPQTAAIGIYDRVGKKKDASEKETEKV